MAAVGDMAIVTYETHAFHPGQYIGTLRCEWRGETVSLLASLTKAKHRPSLVHECGQLRLASPRGEASESRHPLARHEASHARRAASKLASWPSLELIAKDQMMVAVCQVKLV